jgi:hypothetical protein
MRRYLLLSMVVSVFCFSSSGFAAEGMADSDSIIPMTFLRLKNC